MKTTLTYKSHGAFGPNTTTQEHDSRETALLIAETIFSLDETAQIELNTTETLKRSN